MQHYQLLDELNAYVVSMGRHACIDDIMSSGYKTKGGSNEHCNHANPTNINTVYSFS
jgi:hypothetical protein